MGTRNLTAVVVNQQYKIAQYGQWDGYPEGQGATALSFLRKKSNQKLLKEALSRCVFLTGEEIRKGYDSVGVVGDFMTEEESNAFDKLFPYLTRDHGAKILELVANSEGPVQLSDGIDFAKDSLFCEWAYVVDFDRDTLEVYKGFNKSPVPESNRFQGEPQKASENTYYPILLVKTYNLNKLPSKKDFLEELKEKDDE